MNWLWNLNRVEKWLDIWNIEGKVARAAIAKGECEDFFFYLYQKKYLCSARKIVYVFNSNSHELFEKFNGISKALKYAKVNYYTLKVLIEHSTSY